MSEFISVLFSNRFLLKIAFGLMFLLLLQKGMHARTKKNKKS
jgi:hypothetical protein